MTPIIYITRNVIHVAVAGRKYGESVDNTIALLRLCNKHFDNSVSWYSAFISTFTRTVQREILQQSPTSFH